MHDCPRGDIRDLLPDLLHGGLEGDARTDVERHVAMCGECTAELDLLRAMRLALSASEAVDVSAVAAAVRNERSRRPVATRPRPRRLDWRVAAAAAVLVTGGLTIAVVRQTPVSFGGGASGRPDHGVVAGAPANATGLMFGGGVADLSDSDLETLLQDVDSLSALPDVEPAPVLRGVGTEGQ